MKVNVENTGPCRKKISVEFSAEEVDNEYGSSLKYYLRHGTVKGFRPGKAPEAMIRRGSGRGDVDDAPAAFAPITVQSPTPPTPNTATEEPD